MTDEEAIQFLLDLVSVPSVTGEEGNAVQLFLSILTKRGMITAMDEVGNGVATSQKGGRRLVVLGHMDTVPGWVEPKIHDGKIFGRGAVDAKGPLAAAAVAAVRASDTKGIEVIAAVGEEGPSLGARHLAHGHAPDALVILEPSGSDSIVLGYKGSMRATLRFSKPVGHTAGADQTVADDAVDAWMNVRKACSELTSGDRHFDRLSPALLSFETCSDGLNQVAELGASFRLPPGLDIDGARSHIREAASLATVEFGPADPAFRASRASSLVAAFVRSIQTEDISARFKVKMGTSDMNVVMPVWRCQALAYGPGDSSLDHTPNEHVAVDEYLRGIRVLTRVFQEWGRA